MPNAKINVTVNGGTPPTTIQIRLFAPDNSHIDIGTPKSTEHVYTNLTSGDYDLFITGMNAAGGNTVCTLTLDPGMTLTAPDNSPCTRDGNGYSVEFHFNVP